MNSSAAKVNNHATRLELQRFQHGVTPFSKSLRTHSQAEPEPPAAKCFWAGVPFPAPYASRRFRIVCVWRVPCVCVWFVMFYGCVRQMGVYEASCGITVCDPMGRAVALNRGILAVVAQTI